MAYSTIPKGSLYMNPNYIQELEVLMQLTGVGFQPDWTWIKRRNAYECHIYMMYRGVHKHIIQLLLLQKAHLYWY